MKKQQKITPAAEVCAQLPPSIFKDSVFVWGKDGIYPRESIEKAFPGEEPIPAPTAEEIMRAFPPTFMFTVTSIGKATFLEIRIPPTPMEAAALPHKLELADFKLYKFQGEDGVASCLANAMLELLKGDK